MNFAFPKFFIGLLDFFSFLMLGALIPYLLMGEVGLAVLVARYMPSIAENISWVARPAESVWCMSVANSAATTQ